MGIVAKQPPIALDAYEFLAEAYAAKVDTKPHNAYYERPATLSLLPDVSGMDVLDAGCGPGAYAESLVRRGARVVAVDASAKMLELARARAGEAVEFHLADLEGGLPFLRDSFFDVVLAPLVLDYVADWVPLFRRFHQVLKAGGWFIFSAGHPAFDAAHFQTRNYFAVEQVSCLWRGFGVMVEMPSFRRPLTLLVNSVMEAGFELVQLLEPQPTEEFRQADPLGYEKLLAQPGFVCVKARKRAG